MTLKLNDHLEKFYSLHTWPSDPYTPEGRKRYEKAIKCFSNMMGHPFLRDLPSRVRLLDILSGEGIGGVALAKVLGKTRSVNLVMMDLREEALNVARRFSKDELGFEAIVFHEDAMHAHEVVSEVDLALMYGLSTPHFNPWTAAIMLASVSKSMKDDGVFLVEEADRRYGVFYLKGYKGIIPMTKGEEVILDFHREYDVKTGMFRRALLSLKTGELVKFEVYFWGIAEFLALMWLFFEEVDLQHVEESRTGSYILMARRPRKKIDPSDLTLPSFLREND